MTEIQVVEPAEVLVPLSREAEERLDGRIRRLAKQAGDQLVQVGRLLDEARVGNIHEALGFSSWTAYVADSLGGTLQLSGDARQAMVALMAGEGMSVRAIAAATGVSKSTVDRDITQLSQGGTVDSDGVADSTVPQRDSSSVPAESMGLDGKVRRRPVRKPRPKKEPVPKEPPADSGKAGAGDIAATVSELQASTRKVQVPTAYRDIVKAIRPLVDDLVALTRDPRWDKSRERFNHKDRSTLDAHIENLTMVRAAMGELYKTAPTTVRESA